MERTSRKDEKLLIQRINFIPLILLLIVLYIVLQVYMMRFRGVDTIKAVEGYMNDSVISQGIVCRNELILRKNSGGYVYYLAESGERVSSGAHIGSVYSSTEDVSRLKYLRNRKAMLDDVKTVTNYQTGNIMDVPLAKKQLANEMSGVSYDVSTGNYFDAFSRMGKLAQGVNKINLATGLVNDFSPAINQLNNEIAAVESAVSSPLENLYAAHAGYFISYTDGFEDLATVSNLSSMSYEDGINLINSSQEVNSSNSYGKIITDYKWSLCTYIDTTVAEDLKIGRQVSVDISGLENDFRKGTIKNIIDLGDKSLIIIESSVMDSVSAVTRVTDCEILFKQYRGIKIPKTAIHFVDGEMGVFVNYSNMVQFRKIDPMFEDENYVIVPSTPTASNQVKLYDSIIVKGRNLYDGKYL